MQKDKNLNVLMFLLSILGCGIVFVCGELLMFFLGYLPYPVQTGVYLTFAAVVCGLVVFFSELIRSGGYVKHWITHFKGESLKMMVICILGAFVIGFGTQWLYGLIGGQSALSVVDFQGTMLICDTSGSMLDNDPERDAVYAMNEYIRTVPLDERLGIIVYSDGAEVLREYEPLETEDAREELMTYIEETVNYGGGTDTESALMEGFDQIRRGARGSFPGIVLIFSDGLSDVDYNRIQTEARGRIETPEEQIPVNTIYYASSSMGGYQMNHIAQVTGGTYFYSYDRLELADIFRTSRSMYTIEKPHLLQTCLSILRNHPVRITLQILFIAMWGVLIGGMVTLMLDNSNLFRSFFIPRVIVSVVMAVLFVALMNTVPTLLTGFLRVVPVLMMSIFVLPTYRIN
jgi:Ca-activated chloride channel family protein